MEGHFAYPVASVICGSCLRIMFTETSELEPSEFQGDFEYIVFCTNLKCKHCDIRYRVSKVGAIPLERVE
jgi:hypothetical protein